MYPEFSKALNAARVEIRLRMREEIVRMLSSTVEALKGKNLIEQAEGVEHSIKLIKSLRE